MDQASAPHDDADRTPGASLADATFSGMRWATMAKLSGEVLAISGAVALARLVGPAGFGHAAVAQMLMPLAVIITFEGFASILVQRKEDDAPHREMAMLLSLLAGAFLTLVVLAGSLTLGRSIFGRETASLLVLASPVFLIASAGAVPRALLWRALDFRKVSVAEVAGLLVGTVVAVGFAAAGLDGRALIYGTLATVIVTTALLLTGAPWVTPRWHGAARNTIGGFGIPAATAGLVGVGLQNVDYAMVAARLSAGQAGIYWRAFQLGVVYQDKVSGIMLRLAFPVYSRTTDLGELRRLHERATRVHAAVVFPFLATFVVIAPEFVPFVFGDAWSAAVVPSQVLAAAGMAAAVLTGYPQVMLAAGRPQALLRCNGAFLVFYAAIVWFTIPYGITAVAIGVSAAYAVMLVAVYRFLLRPTLGLPVLRLVSDVGPPLVACAGAAVAGVSVRELVFRVGAGDVLTMAVVAITCLGFYAALLWAIFPALWAELDAITQRIVPARLRGRRAAASPLMVGAEGS
jgi:O-antigen/teichoic acid export membrane protein